MARKGKAAFKFAFKNNRFHGATQRRCNMAPAPCVAWLLLCHKKMLEKYECF